MQTRSTSTSRTATRQFTFTRTSTPPHINDIDGYTGYERDYYDVVDYGDTVQRYFLGTVTTYVADADVDVPRFRPPVIDMSQTYNLIVALPKTTDLKGAASAFQYTGDKTIVIEPGVVGGITVDAVTDTVSFTPVNAVLFGGSGNDHLEYDASGQATLVGGSGSNDLEGGTLEYGNFVTLEASVNPTFGLPPDVVNAITQSAIFPAFFDDSYGFPLPGSGLGSNNLVGTAGNDILIGGPAGNTFDGLGGTDREFGGLGEDLYLDTSSDYRSGSLLNIYSGNPAIFGDARDAALAAANRDELDVDAGAGTEQRLGPAPNTFANVTIGTNPNRLVNDTDGNPADLPVYVTGPTSGSGVVASGLKKVEVTGDGSYTINDLFATTVSQVQIGLVARPLPKLPSGFTPDPDNNADRVLIRSNRIGNLIQ